MNWILKINNLSKIYRIGAGVSQKGTLYEQISKKIKKRFLPTQTNDQIALLSTGRQVISKDQSDGLPEGYFWALNNINLQIAPGERIGFIGPNGSGKSTLLKILSRITAPTHGEFRYRGHLISLLEVGTGFHPELSGRENIYLNAAINGMTRKQINERYASIVEFSELGSQIDTPVKRYSSGMYMRLAFSVAAFLESEILVIDEVLAVGDADFQKKCKEKMLEVANGGRTVIFVSHDMDAINSICNKTVELAHGKIIAINDVPKTKTPLLSNEIFSSNQELFTTAPRLVDILEIVALHLKNDEGTIQNEFTVDENINIEVKFKILTNGTRLNLNIMLTTLEGIKLFTLQDFSPTSKETLRREGVYSEKVTIPKDFLNKGQFLISILFNELEGTLQQLNCDDCLVITIVNKHTNNSNDLIRTNFNWQHQFEFATQECEEIK